MDKNRDTIIALATPPGRSALAVVRLSGPNAEEILGKVFRHRGKNTAVEVRRPTLGLFLDRRGEPCDEGLAILYRGPRSYSGEDLVEMMLHGSPPVISAVVAACQAAGARVAAPGEFTQRALEAGKIDLTQAEAIADLVSAATVEQARIAVRQLSGEVSGAITPLADQVFDLLADVEAGLEFSDDEDLGLSWVEISCRARRLAQEITRLLGASEAARVVREGARVVLLGPPNSGKSSVFNNLAEHDRVIVTAEPGTTRDLVEELIVLEGLPVVLIDSAGIRESVSKAEQEGVRRALAAAETAHLVLDVYDLTQLDHPEPSEDPRRLLVGTHADLDYSSLPVPGSVLVSNTTGFGFPTLRKVLAQRLGAPGTAPLEAVALATARHRQCAQTAVEALREAADLAEGGNSPELVALPLRSAVQELRELLGEIGPEALLGRIFSRFCIGK